MNNSLIIFQAILNDTKNISSLYQYIHYKVKPPFDDSDLLRWQWAQAISALDKLIHDLVRAGMLNIYMGTRPATPTIAAFPIDYETHHQIRNNPVSELDFFAKIIVQRHSFQSFQTPENIAKALSLIWSEPQKWYAIGQKMNLSEEYVKKQLKNISIRRNQIVHEGDYPHGLAARQNITQSDVDDVISFVEKLGKAIYDLVK